MRTGVMTLSSESRIDPVATKTSSSLSWQRTTRTGRTSKTAARAARAARTVLSAGSSNVTDGRLVSSVTSHGSVDAGRVARCAWADDARSNAAIEIRSVRMTV